MSRQLSRDSTWFMVRGILAIALGILAFAYPAPTLAALIIVFAFYAILDGVLAIGAGSSVPGRPSWWLIVGGIAAIAVGVFTFFQPNTTALALVLFVGIFAIVTGTAELVTAAALGKLAPHRWLLALSGVVAVAFGLLLILSPGAGILTVLWLIGLYAIFAGVLYIALGFRLRDASHALKSVEAQSKPATA